MAAICFLNQIPTPAHAELVEAHARQWTQGQPAACGLRQAQAERVFANEVGL